MKNLLTILKGRNSNVVPTLSGLCGEKGNGNSNSCTARKLKTYSAYFITGKLDFGLPA